MMHAAKSLQFFLLMTLGVFSAEAATGVADPWTSKALSPVSLELKKDIPPLTLCADGKAACDIVIPSSGERSSYYKEVAERLKYFLDKAIGADVPIITDRSLRKAIYIGPSEHEFVKAVYAKCDALPLESLSIVSFENGIVLAGRDGPSPVKDAGILARDSQYHSRGTFFAVADFLERMLGFRFYFPGDMGMHIPDLTGATVIVPAVAYNDRPVFALRKSSYPGYETLDAPLLKVDAKRRVLWDRMLRSGDVLYENFGHTDVYWHEFYANEHPEYFALRDDGTRATGDRGTHSSQRCYASEEGLREHVRQIERSLAGESNARLFNASWYAPNGKYIYWWPNDGYKGCACDGCMKRTDLNAPPYAIYSKIIWDYALRLSRAVAAKWPDKVLKVPIYPYYGAIPEGVVVPENIALNIVKFGTGRAPAAYLKEPDYWNDAVEEIDALNKRSKQKLWIWVHYPHSPRIRDSVMIPYPVPHYMQKFMMLNREKISGLYLNGHSMSSYAFDGLMVYLWQKLLWNPDIDVDALVDEFSLLWGPAAGEMKEFHKLLIDRWENVKWENIPAPKEFNFNMPRSVVWERTYTKDVRARLLSLLDAALAKTKAGTIYAARAEYMKKGYEPFFEQGVRHDANVVFSTDCPRSTPVIDGDLGEWNEPISLVDNRTGKAADERTLIYTAHDDAALYIAGSAFQKTPFKTIVPGARDASLWNNDSIEIFISADREGIKEAGMSVTAQYHHLVIDTSGAVYDAYRGISQKSEDKKVDIEHELRTKRSDGRFDFEMRIPFTSLGAITPSAGTEWAVNFYRTRIGDRPEESRAYGWSATLSGFHQPEKFGILSFPKRKLWEKQFTAAADTFVVESTPANAEVRIDNRDGRCFIHVTTSPGTVQKEFKIVLKDIPDRAAEGHAVVEWKYECQGSGLKRIRSYGADTKAKLTLENITREFGANDGGVPITVRHEFTKDKKTLRAVTYFAVGMLPLAGADFTLIVDHVRAYDAKSAGATDR
ncbi:MAG: DUF4838 domain-containing protein [Spirochaetota bacterium]